MKKLLFVLIIISLATNICADDKKTKEIPVKVKTDTSIVMAATIVNRLVIVPVLSQDRKQVFTSPMEVNTMEWNYAYRVTKGLDNVTIYDRSWKEIKNAVSVIDRASVALVDTVRYVDSKK